MTQLFVTLPHCVQSPGTFGTPRANNAHRIRNGPNPNVAQCRELDEIVIENNVTIHDHNKNRKDVDLEESDSTEHNYKSTVTITASNGQIMRR